MIRVLIVEDSPTVREFLKAILASAPGIEVAGTVGDGLQALEAVKRLRPDVVTMDIHMPGIDGFEATRRIMEEHPVPIVVVSSTMSDQMAATFRAVEAGALSFVRRPTGLGHDGHQAGAALLVDAVRLMSEVKVVRRWKKAARAAERPAPRHSGKLPRLVVVGASTGGPMVLKSMLQSLPRDFGLPVMVVQHIAPGFLESFAQWLAGSTVLRVEPARNGTIPLPGHIYLAPDGCHLGIGRGGAMTLGDGPPENGLKPSVSHLFRTAADTYGASTVAVLLTGMGTDGAKEMKELRTLGALTIAQDRESSVIHGMPGAAIAMGAATHVLPPEEIGLLLAELGRAAARGELPPCRDD